MVNFESEPSLEFGAGLEALEDDGAQRQIGQQQRDQYHVRDQDLYQLENNIGFTYTFLQFLG